MYKIVENAERRAVGSQALILLAAGIPVILLYRFEAGEVLRLIELHHATFTVGPLTAFIALPDHPAVATPDVSSLRPAMSCGAPVLSGLVHPALILLVLPLFFELYLSHAIFVTATYVMFAGSFTVVGIGIMAAILPLLYVERGAQMTFVIQSCLLVVSGVYYPVSVLPGWMQVASAFSPATYILDGVRKGLMEGASVGAVVHDLWPLALMGAILIPLGLWLFGRAEHYAKRTGKLKRVG